MHNQFSPRFKIVDITYLAKGQFPGRILLFTMLVSALCCFQMPGNARSESILSSHKNNAEAENLQIKGTLLQLKGDLKEAVLKYRQSLKLKPNPQLEDLVLRLEKRLNNTETSTPVGSKRKTPSAGWHYVSTLSASQSSIADVCRDGSSSLYAVTSDEILHFVDQQWKVEDIPDVDGGVFLKAIGCIGRNDIYAVGKHVLHYNGTVWQQVKDQIVAGGQWSTIWHTGDGRIVMAGNEQMIVHDGSRWSVIQTGLHSGDYIMGVWGTSLDNFFAIGFSFGDGFVLQCNSRECSTVKTVKGKRLYDLYGTSGTDIDAVGDVMLHYDGNTWLPVQLPEQTRSLEVINGFGTPLVAAGNSGTVIQHTQEGWQSLHCPYDILIQAFWQAPDKSLYFAGLPGPDSPGTNSIVSWDGKQWSVQNSWLLDTIEFPDGSIFTVGTMGTIRTFADGQWQTMLSNTTEDLRSIWGSSSSDIYAVGTHGTIVHYDGKTWERKELDLTLTSPDLLSIWGSAPDDIYVMAANNKLYRYDGRKWSYLNAHFDDMDQLVKISGRSATDIYAAGNVVYHFNGEKWAKLRLPENQTNIFDDMAAIADGNLALVYAATLYIFDGTSWSSIKISAKDSSKNVHLTSLWGSSANNIFVTGYEHKYHNPSSLEGLIAHYDGEQWREVMRFPGQMPLSIAGANGEATVIVGSNGLIGMRGVGGKSVPDPSSNTGERAQ